MQMEKLLFRREVGQHYLRNGALQQKEHNAFNLWNHRVHNSGWPNLHAPSLLTPQQGSGSKTGILELEVATHTTYPSHPHQPLNLPEPLLSIYNIDYTKVKKKKTFQHAFPTCSFLIA